MRIKFINRKPRKGEAILLTDGGAELERVECWAHTDKGKAQAKRTFEDLLVKMGVPLEEQKFTFTEELER